MTSRLHPVNSRLVAWARIGVGVAAITRGIEGIPVLVGLTDPQRLRVPYVSWLNPTSAIVTTLIVVWIISAALFTVGYRSRTAGVILTLTIAMVLALDRQTYSNHLYLMMLLAGLLTVSDSGAALSIDAVRGRSSSTTSGWVVFLLKCQVSIVYGFAALWKLNVAFLSGSVLAGQLGTGLVSFPEGLRTSHVLAFMSVAAVASEFTIAIGIWFTRSRGAAIALAVILHASIVAFMAPTVQLLIFAVELMVLYPLFIGGHERVIVRSDSCPTCRTWVGRLSKADLFGLLRPECQTTQEGPSAAAGRQRSLDDAIWLVDGEEQYSGFEAVRRILGLLPVIYLLAPFLGLPGIRQLGAWWYRRIVEPGSPRKAGAR